jgi:Ca-activated chloride channel family protein
MIFRSLAAIAATTLIAALVGAASAPPSSASEDEFGRLVMVLDSSGSMDEKDQSGAKKIDAAKESLHTVVDDLPSDAFVGMRVFGATVFSRDDTGACEDSQLVVPLDKGNRDALNSEIDKYEPYGETPIAYALQEAAKDIGSEGKRTIVLVSDGEATCEPDPCEVAENIAGQGIDLRIDVVGLDVDGAARDQLKCVAEKGNGTYYDAGNADELTESLSTSATRAAQPFEVTGEPVDGAPSVENAPQLVPGGRYVDTIPVEGERKYYKISREADNSTIVIGAVSQPNIDGIVAAMRLTLTTPDGEKCATGYAATMESVGNNFASGSVASISDDATDPAGPCNTADELHLLIEQDNPLDVTLPEAPLQLSLWEYGEAPNWQELPGASHPNDPKWVAVEADMSNASEITGGASFGSAPELTPSETYSGTIVPGDSLVFRVNADWGQQVQAQVNVALPTAEQAELYPFSGTIAANIFGPTGAEASNDMDSEGNLDLYVNGYQAFDAVLQTGTAPVRYQNLLSAHDSVQAAGLAGEYYVVVSLSDERSDDGVEVPFHLTASLEGEAGAGTPEFASMLQPGDVANDEDDGKDAETEPTQSQSSSTESPSTDEPSSPETDGVEPAASSGDGVDTITVGIGLGGVGLLLLGGYGIRRFLG